MKALFRDAVALVGVGSLTAGLHVQFGPGIALIVVGCLLLVGAVTSARRRGGA